MHLAPLIRDLAVILASAGLVTLLFRKIRQPVVLGYIVAGLIVGPYSHSISDLPSVQTWAELGLIFLMFSLGLEFSFRKLSKVGLSAALTCLIEVSFMIGLGFAAARLMGWPLSDSLFLGAMISISSTTVIIKALDELGLKTRRFAQMILGILIVEDLAAILILVALSTGAESQGISGFKLLGAFGQLVLVVGGWFLAGYFVLPRFVRYVGKHGNDEMLTLVSVALCLILAVFAAYFDYSVALGAFIMGSILSESTESHRISERLEPLRDLFAAVFFVSVGMLIDPHVLVTHWAEILVITALVMGGKIFGVTFGALVTGQTLRSAVQVGFGLAQIGEFSFIIAALGLTLHLTSSSLYAVAVAVSVITTFTTPYLIRVSHKFAVALELRLPLRLKTALTHYAAWTQERSADAASRQLFYRALSRWILNGIVISVLFTLTRALVAPRLAERLDDEIWSELASWTLAMIVSAPFLWGMWRAFRDFQLGRAETAGETQDARRVPRGGTLLLVRFLTLAWAGLLSLEFFPVQWVAPITFALAAALFYIFYRQLEATYRWFEKRFLSTFETAPKSRRSTDVLRHLAPWDAHLVRIKVHPNAEIAAKSIAGSQLRARYGLNVVAIQRGLKTIVAPKPEELILPKDELLVLGTDEQIEAVKPAIERPPGLEDRFKHTISEYNLRQLRVAPASLFLGKTIRQSEIRERYGAMVVGIERSQRRMINPESDLVLELEDVLWIVGEAERLENLLVEASRTQV